MPTRDRVAADAVAEHFEHSAEAYARHVAPCFEAARRYAEREAAASGARRIADVACGDGGLAAALARLPSREVVAVDRSERMVAIARKRSAAVRWVVADAEDLPLPTHAHDLVICNLSLPLFARPARALAELRRIAAPGGTLLLSWLAQAGAPSAATPLGTLLEAAGLEASRRAYVDATVAIDHAETLVGIWSGEVGPAARAGGEALTALADARLAAAGGRVELAFRFEFFHVSPGGTTNGAEVQP